ncbi:MAG TPA: hypothetical protein VIF57_31130 [Polyangia bacterium]|jgi:hypothetical protein
MQRSRLVLVSACFAGLLSLSQCSAPTSEPTPGNGGSSAAGTSGSAGSSGTTGSGGTTGTGNTTGIGGTAGTGNTTGSGGTTNPGTAGSISTAGSGGSAGGATGNAGRGGTTGSAGSGSGGTTTGSGGTTTGTGGTATGTGGTTNRGGTTGSGGTSGVTGSGGTAGTGPIVDQGGVGLAKPGDMATGSKGYLNLGDMRLINNRWGSDALNCTSSMQKVYVTGDSLIGWDFNRPACGGMRGDPDFPEVEFGVAPFGRTSTNLTTPAFSSTTLLPLQIKSITSATVDVQNFVTTIQSADPPSYWDSTVEFWVSKLDPRTNDNAQVYAEIILFLGWENNRLSSSAGGWTCDKSGSLTAGANQYTLCHQSDTWANGQWRFFNFNVNGGPMKTFNGKVDVKAALNWVMSTYTGFTTDMWLTRIEVGTEIDDSTKGVVRINNLVFEVNGQTRGMQLAK